jgi:hypothetical protein
VTLSKRVEGVETVIAGPETFRCIPLGTPSVPNDRQVLAAFQKNAAKLHRVAFGALNVLNDVRAKVGAIKSVLMQTPQATPALHEKVLGLEKRLTTLRREFTGDEVYGRFNENDPPTLWGRLDAMTQGFWSSTADPTGTAMKAYQIAADQFETMYASLRQIVNSDVPALEKELDHVGAPWTPGRLPDWKKE